MTKNLHTKSIDKIPLQNRAMRRAWLITWRTAGAGQPEKVVAFFNARRSVQFVSDLVTQIWLADQAPWERIEWAKHPEKSPYVAEVDLYQRVTIGHNPYLFARVVENLIDDDQDRRGYSWLEIDRPHKG